MVIRNKHYLFILFFCLGCNVAPKGKIINKDTLKFVTKSVSISISTSQYKNRIIGIWSDGNTENATFDIRKDSIYYVDQLKAYKYLVHNDSIKIYYDDFSYAAKIHFVKDTLIMDSKDDGISKYWKFKD